MNRFVYKLTSLLSILLLFYYILLLLLYLLVSFIRNLRLHEAKEAGCKAGYSGSECTNK